MAAQQDLWISRTLEPQQAASATMKQCCKISHILQLFISLDTHTHCKRVKPKHEMATLALAQWRFKHFRLDVKKAQLAESCFCFSFCFSFSFSFRLR